jgi:hypothetical protein
VLAEEGSVAEGLAVEVVAAARSRRLVHFFVHSSHGSRTMTELSTATAASLGWGGGYFAVSWKAA